MSADPRDRYGFGIRCVDGLPRGRWSWSSGGRLVCEAVVRGWYTEPGSMPWAPDEGASLEDLLHGSEDVATVALRLESSALRDERVETCDVTATLDDNNTLHIDATIELVDGETFTIVATAGNVTIEEVG